MFLSDMGDMYDHENRNQNDTTNVIEFAQNFTLIKDNKLIQFDLIFVNSQIQNIEQIVKTVNITDNTTTDFLENHKVAILCMK